MRKKHDEHLKALATDEVTPGWTEALPHFAAEVRHNLQVFVILMRHDDNIFRVYGRSATVTLTDAFTIEA